VEKEKIKAFADRVYADMAGAMTAGMAYVGTKTGLFRTMAGKRPMRLDDVVRESGLQRRYVDEWLKGMAAAGYLEYDAAAETYALPEEHAYLLASDDTDHFMGGLFSFAPVLLRAAPEVAEAFKKGGGVHFHEYGTEGVEAVDLINRGHYEHRLTSYWLKAMPEAVARLEAGGRALDVGCGVGRVAIALAKAFPKAEIVGLDRDEESIRRARKLAAADKLGDRIRFVVGTTGELPTDGGFDLITACDCVHDLAEPLKTLQEIRALLKPDGTLFIVEPRAADRLEDNRNAIGTMYYGFSLFHCMTQSLARGGPGLGTCLGPARLEALVREAGFRRFERLDLKSQVIAFYAVRP
jgi:ubiquinone/menaquinone biosynthesis C-methylase UbiE